MKKKIEGVEEEEENEMLLCDRRSGLRNIEYHEIEYRIEYRRSRRDQVIYVICWSRRDRRPVRVAALPSFSFFILYGIVIVYVELIQKSNPKIL